MFRLREIKPRCVVPTVYLFGHRLETSAVSQLVPKVYLMKINGEKVLLQRFNSRLSHDHKDSAPDIFTDWRLIRTNWKSREDNWFVVSLYLDFWQFFFLANKPVKRYRRNLEQLSTSIIIAIFPGYWITASFQLKLFVSLKPWLLVSRSLP